MADEQRAPTRDEVLETDAVLGLHQGELVPLARYLRAGLPLTDDLRSSIIDAIEPEGSDWPEYLLITQKRRRGAGDMFSRVWRYKEQLDIARFVDEQTPAHDGSVEAAVHAAMEEFGVKRSTVMQVRKVAKEGYSKSRE